MAQIENEIPIKITALKKRDKKLNIKQLSVVAIIIPIYVMALITLYQKFRYFEETGAKVLIIVLLMIASLLVLRLSLFLFFNEEAEYKLYKKYENKPLIGLDEFWDIYSINKYGVLLMNDNVFGGQVRALIVKMERSNTIGRQPDFKEEHYQSVSKFLQRLLEKNYFIRRYDLTMNDTNSENFEIIEKNMESISNNKLKDTVKEILQYNRLSVMDTKNRALEYYMIISTTPRDNIINDVNEALSQLGVTSIYKPQICQDKELMKFFKAFNKQSIIDVKRLLMNKLPEQSVFTVENVVRTSVQSSIFDVSVTKEDYVIEKFKKLRESLEEDKKNV